MDFVIEARVRRSGPRRGRASVHIIFDVGSSMTISNIEIREENGNLIVKMPPFGRRPDIALQGNIKQQVQTAVKSQFQDAVDR